MTAYKSAIATVAKSAMCGLQPYSCPVEVTLRLWRKYKNTSRRYGDCDNHLKSIMDALNGVVYLDDAQIISASVKKIQSTTPKVEVEIRPVEEVN
jgi:Holliday junction resolvase RusA-like endonuclease